MWPEYQEQNDFFNDIFICIHHIYFFDHHDIVSISATSLQVFEKSRVAF